MKITLVAGLVFFLTLQCSKDIVSECAECPDDRISGPMTTLADIQSNVFNPHCISCHGGTNPEAGLNLQAGVAYANLVNVQAATAAAKRVLPFNSSASYLVQVLEGTEAPQMPPPGRLSQAKIDSIKIWIDRGAENN